MPEALPKSKKKEDGCFLALLKGFGCFIVSIIFFSIVFLGIGYYFFSPIIKAIRTETALPNFEGPTEHDFWSLQEKQLQDKDNNNSDKEWNLNHGEFNAWLSSIRVPPVSGLYLIKARHSYINNELRYYLICSGYTLKRLNISFIVDNNNPANIKNIKVNSWVIPSGSIYEKYIICLINDIANADKSRLLNKIIQGELKPFPNE